MKPDPKLLNIFATEQPEHVQRIRALAEALAGGASQPGAFDEALRRAHTLKGAARAVGLQKTELLAHTLEGLFLRGREGALVFDGRALRAAHQALDAAEDVLASCLSGAAEPDVSGAQRAIQALVGGPAAAAAPEGAGGLRAAAPPTSPGAPSELVRVDAKSIDGLIRAASDLLSTASAESLAATRSEEYFERLQDALRQWQSLRRASARYAREKGEDPGFAPVAQCLSFVDGELPAAVNAARISVAAQRQRARDLHERFEALYGDACRVRTTPAETVFGGLGSMVRDLARAENKEVEFRAEGLGVEADRLVLQALRDPVMHLLRNAVSHGVETPAEREAAGKPRAGQVRLGIDARKNRLRLVVEDDGRGLDAQRIAEAAVAQGWLTPAEVAAKTAGEIARIVFQPGFTTASSVTKLAGRGVGLSVVQEAVAALRGEAAIRTRERAGVCVEVSVPISISTQHVLLAQAGGHVFGLPAGSVERLWRGNVENVERVEGREAIRVDSQPVFLAKLSEVLGIAESAPPPPEEDAHARFIHVAVVASGGRRAGFIVDRLLDDREAVIKDLGLPASMSGLTAGGIPLEDGRVAVVLAPGGLLDRFRDSGRSAVVRALAKRPARKRPRILVVDDSITTRSLERSILEAHGYQVRVAVDGVQALEELRAEPADLVITDIMMPRMDGLDLLRHIKNDGDIAHVPVIVVTSMEKREDQERGLSLGADAYIVKRKFDQRELLDTVRQIL